MIYICNNCKFLFSRTGEPDGCPDCGNSSVKEADKEEKKSLKGSVRNLTHRKNANKSRLKQ